MLNTTEGLVQASEIFKGDWDAERTMGIELPYRFAEALLRGRGWRKRDGAWFAPNGDKYWHTNEALRIALAAEVLGNAATARAEVEGDRHRDAVEQVDRQRAAR